MHQPLGESGSHARNALNNLRDLARDPVDDLKVRPGDLDPDGTLNAGSEHVDPVASG
jgi:hypothetical protein